MPTSSLPRVRETKWEGLAGYDGMVVAMLIQAVDEGEFRWLRSGEARFWLRVLDIQEKQFLQALDEYEDSLIREQGAGLLIRYNRWAAAHRTA